MHRKRALVAATIVAATLVAVGSAVAVADSGRAAAEHSQVGAQGDRHDTSREGWRINRGW